MTDMEATPGANTMETTGAAYDLLAGELDDMSRETFYVLAVRLRKDGILSSQRSGSGHYASWSLLDLLVACAYLRAKSATRFESAPRQGGTATPFALQVAADIAVNGWPSTGVVEVPITDRASVLIDIGWPPKYD